MRSLFEDFPASQSDPSIFPGRNGPRVGTLSPVTTTLDNVHPPREEIQAPTVAAPTVAVSDVSVPLGSLRTRAVVGFLGDLPTFPIRAIMNWRTWMGMVGTELGAGLLGLGIPDAAALVVGGGVALLDETQGAIGQYEKAKRELITREMCRRGISLGEQGRELEQTPSRHQAAAREIPSPRGWVGERCYAEQDENVRLGAIATQPGKFKIVAMVDDFSPAEREEVDLTVVDKNEERNGERLAVDCRRQTKSPLINGD